jgi:hypothetical protein
VYELHMRSSSNTLYRHNNLHGVNLDSLLPLLFSCQETGTPRGRNEESVANLFYFNWSSVIVSVK